MKGCRKVGSVLDRIEKMEWEDLAGLSGIWAMRDLQQEETILFLYGRSGITWNLIGEEWESPRRGKLNRQGLSV